LNLTSFMTVPCTLDGGNGYFDWELHVGTRHFGNEGRNSLLGPNYRDLDLAISKVTAINERLKVQFRADYLQHIQSPCLCQPVVAGLLCRRRT
jgi:hypothetical protein